MPDLLLVSIADSNIKHRGEVSLFSVSPMGPYFEKMYILGNGERQIYFWSSLNWATNFTFDVCRFKDTFSTQESPSWWEKLYYITYCLSFLVVFVYSDYRCIGYLKHYLKCNLSQSSSYNWIVLPLIPFTLPSYIYNRYRRISLLFYMHKIILFKHQFKFRKLVWFLFAESGMRRLIPLSYLHRANSQLA